VAVDGLVAAGDWLLGPEAGDAHASGLAAAAALGA
jgi:predicted NAD/FAD-dependent oxidoreductase